jgi:Uncharacterized protein conserved in bacteria (DUF2314)
MFGWLKRKVSFAGSVLYRGNLPPRPEDFERLQAAGMILRPITGWRGAHWALHAIHPQWGEADLVCMRDAPRLPRALIEQSANLSPREKALAASGESSVSVRIEMAGVHALRERKQALRFLHALMDADATLAIDHVSFLLWSRAALDDEMQHDADLDISGLYCMHAIADAEGQRVQWLHTHGLAAIGAFDFDILNPAAELLGVADAGLRALALAILEGEVNESSDRFQLGSPRPTIALVPAAEFMRSGPPAETALRDPQDHTERRSVVCEPRGGFRFFGGARPRANRFLSQPIDDGIVLRFSKDATALMMQRARNTYHVFRAARAELAGLPLPALVKIGYPTDGGGGDNEYLWFAVHSADDSSVDATLENSPHQVASLKHGDRGRHSIERLADWVIFTPTGPITPNSLAPLRHIREHRPEIEAMLKRSAAEQNPDRPGGAMR